MQYVFITLIILIIHLNPVLHPGGLNVPADILTLPILLACSFIIIFRRSLHDIYFSKKSMLLLFAIFSIVFLSCFCQLLYGIFDYNTIIDILRIIAACLLASSIYIIVKWGKSTHRYFLGVLIGIAILSTLESFTNIGDYIRSSLFPVLYPNNSLNEARSLSLAGFIRPTLLATEPSHLAKTSNLIVASYWLAGNNQTHTSNVLVILLSVILLWLVHSPILLGAVIISLLGYFLYETTLKKRVLLTGIAIISLILSVFYVGDRFTVLLKDTSTLLASSTGMRLVGGFVVAFDVLSSKYWLAGLGLNAKMYVQDFSSYAQMLPAYAALGHNSIARLIISFGSMGLLLFSLITSYFVVLCRQKSHKLLMASFIVFLSFSTGSVTSFLFWESLAFCFAVERSWFAGKRVVPRNYKSNTEFVFPE